MTLTDCLATQAAALEAYLQLLEEEASALREGRFAQVPALVARKVHLAQRLAQLDRTRQQLQQVEGFDPDASAHRPGTLQAPSAPTAIQDAWSRLRERALAAREANHRNGLVVNTLLTFTREALGVLHGGGRPLYGPQGGHLERTPGGRCLGQG